MQKFSFNIIWKVCNGFLLIFPLHRLHLQKTWRQRAPPILRWYAFWTFFIQSTYRTVLHPWFYKSDLYFLFYCLSNNFLQQFSNFIAKSPFDITGIMRHSFVLMTSTASLTVILRPCEISENNILELVETNQVTSAEEMIDRAELSLMRRMAVLKKYQAFMRETIPLRKL